MKKGLIIIVLLAAAALIYYYGFYTPGTSAATSGGLPVDNSPFGIDDEATYKAMRAKFSVADQAWIDPEVTKTFSANPQLIAGKPSKAATFHQLTYAMSANPSGKFKNPYTGGQMLWDISIFDSNGALLQTLQSKYNTL